MAKSSGHEPKVLGSKPKELGANLDAFVSYLKDLYPRDTAKQVANAADLKLSTVEAWLEKRAGPSLPALIALLRAFGPMPLAALSPESFGWLDDAVRAAKRDEVSRKIEELEAIRESLR